MQIVTKVELLQKCWIYTKRCDILLDKERDDMKRAIYISILCTVMLTACGNVSESTKSAETSDVSQTAVTVTSAKEEKDTSEAATTTRKSSQTVSETSKPTDITVTTTKKSDPSGYSGNSSQGQNNSAQNNNGQENNYQPVQNDPQPDNSPSDNNRSNNGAEQNNDPTPPTTTAKPAVTNPPTTTTPKPQTTTVLQTQPPLPVPTEEERYMDIGRSLSHNGSDYSKAEAVYNWMTENGSGTCVNYSWQTYYLCKGTGLECYLAWTPSKLYGHVANVVKVNGTWFVLDTQGQGFLLNNDCGFSEIIDIDESYVSGADLISNQRYDEIY